MDCDTAFRNRRVEGMVSDLVRTERLKQQGIGVDYLTATNAYWQLYTNRLARLRRLNQLTIFHHNNTVCNLVNNR